MLKLNADNHMEFKGYPAATSSLPEIEGSLAGDNSLHRLEIIAFCENLVLFEFTRQTQVMLRGMEIILIRSIFMLSPLMFTAFLLSGKVSLAEPKESSTYQKKSEFAWQQVEEGFSISRYPLGSATAILKSEVLLLRFDPKQFVFATALASNHGTKLANMRVLTKKEGGIAGINTNFFDPKGSPLGLIISNKKQKNRMHQGGRLLTGVFYLYNDKAHITHRSTFSQNDAQLALQAGPRLIVDGKALNISSDKRSTRRSGIAITKSGHIIIYSTFLRFPGATLGQIQSMLLDPRIRAIDALNLDGGGSSQLFIAKNGTLVDDTFISGGEKVPVGLIVKRSPKRKD